MTAGAGLFALIEFDLTKIARILPTASCPPTKNSRGPCATRRCHPVTPLSDEHRLALAAAACPQRALPGEAVRPLRKRASRPPLPAPNDLVERVLAKPHVREPSANCGGWCAQALATFFTLVAFEAEVRDGARMQRPWTDHGLKLGCRARRADASSAAVSVTNCSAEEGRNLPAPAVATP